MDPPNNADSIPSTNSKEIHIHKERKEFEVINTHDSRTSGLLNIRAITFLLLWYIFSGCTLFLNKYILTYLNGNPTVLGM